MLKFFILKNCCLFLNLTDQCNLHHFCSCWWLSAFVFKTECEADFLVNVKGWCHRMYVETVLKDALEVLAACFTVSLQCELWVCCCSPGFLLGKNLPAVEGKIQRYSTTMKEEVKEKYRTCKLKIICQVKLKNVNSWMQYPFFHTHNFTILSVAFLLSILPLSQNRILQYTSPCCRAFYPK